MLDYNDNGAVDILAKSHYGYRVLAADNTVMVGSLLSQIRPSSVAVCLSVTFVRPTHGG